jgi:hypothetical protein
MPKCQKTQNRRSRISTESLGFETRKTGPARMRGCFF